MNRIVPAINSGFSDKALEILKEYDHFLSINQIYKLLNLSFNLDVPNIFLWLITCSDHRFEIESSDVKLNTYFRRACTMNLTEIAKSLFSLKKDRRVYESYML